MNANTHTHTHTCMYVCMYVCVCVCVCVYIYYRKRGREIERASNVCSLPALGTYVKRLAFVPNIFSSAYSTYVYVWVTVRCGICAVLFKFMCVAVSRIMCYMCISVYIC
jgi:hypothetical protein